MESFYPLSALYGYRDTDKMTFIAPGMAIDVEINDLDILELTLKLCNGYKTAESIAEEISQQTDYEAADILDLLNELREKRIVVSAFEYFIQYHTASSNPMPFMRQVSDEQAWKMTQDPSPLLIGPIADGSLMQLLLKRVSSRDFDPTAKVTIEELNCLLWTMFGRVHDRQALINRGTVPSGGALYPTRLSVIATNVIDLPKAVYKVLPSGLQEPMTYDQTGVITAMIEDNELVERASCLIVISSDLSRSHQKYGNRAYRYALLEAGHVAQNAYLWCAENNLKILELGGFIDEKIAQIINVSYPTIPLLVLAVGGQSS